MGARTDHDLALPQLAQRDERERRPRGSPPSRALRADLLEPTELTEKDRAAWIALGERTTEPNPFFESAFLLPAIACLGEPDVAILAVRDPVGEWRACLPVRSSRAWRRVPLRGLVTWRHPYGFLGTPLVARNSLEPAARTLLARLLDRPGGSFAGLDLLAAEGPVTAAITEAAADSEVSPIVYADFARGALQHGSMNGSLPMSRKHERGLARVRRRLQEKLGDSVETVDRAGDPAAVERFLALEVAGWKGRQGTALSSLPGHADFFREACKEFADLGRLSLLSLEAGDRVLGMKVSLRAGDTMFGFKIAYDESLASFSPGIQLETDYMKRCEDADGIRFNDSCADPTNEMANRLWPDRRRIRALVLPARGFRGALAGRFLEVAAAVRARRSIRS